MPPWDTGPVNHLKKGGRGRSTVHTSSATAGPAFETEDRVWVAVIQEVTGGPQEMNSC